jgi:hypothetical protein
MGRRKYKLRKVTSRSTPAYQLGHYEMTGEKGRRRSVFKVDVHLGEYATAEDALAAWPQEADHLRQIGRESKAEKLADKLATLRELTEGDDVLEIGLGLTPRLTPSDTTERGS